MTPFFSIITATRNAAAPLPGLLESLAAQTCRDFELVMQDGASTDGTVAVAESYRSRLPGLSLASEPDTGIYDAWNKAVSRARGEWLLFLGADDALAGPAVLEHVKAVLTDQPQSMDFAAGRGRMLFAGGEVYAELPVKLSEVDRLFEYGCPVCHPSLFYRRALFATDLFDTKFRIAADYDFLCRNWQTSRVMDLDILVTNMLLGGVSTTAALRVATVHESLHIAQKRFGRYPRPLVALYGKSLLHLVFHKLLGERLGNRLYDVLRRLNGRDPLWTRDKAP